jgi:hypothetical protein
LKIAGGIISVLAIIILFIVNTKAFVWPMFIFPVNALLFIDAGYRIKKAEKNKLSTINENILNQTSDSNK